MIHWTYNALRPCAEATLAFFWGEAAWGITEGLRRLRVLRLAIILLAILACSLVLWAMVERAVVQARNNDSYSYYEGKVLEERVLQLQRKIEGQSDDIKRLLTESNTATLLAIRMQSQLERQQELLDAGVKVLGAVVVIPTIAFLWSIFKSGLRKERVSLGRRDENDRH